jgi:hypothetical protein
VKFSDLLGEPEPEETPAASPAERRGAPDRPDPITVFVPVPEPDPAPPPAPMPTSSEEDVTVPVRSVPPPVNPPNDGIDPPFDPVIPPIDPVLDAPPPVDPFLDPTPPDPPVGVGDVGRRSDLASLNVHQPAPEPDPAHTSLTDQLAGLDEVVDDLLPPRRGRR